ncbi:hypothetical protein FRB99_004704 [Tulasnella sp. 403]|nr:hypothetical protein FRB99_004704 [Tulasnella sp. 403]
MVSATIGKGPEAVQNTIDHVKQSPGGNLGSWLLGLLAVSYFLGVLSSQSFTYFMSYPHDSPWFKRLVIACIVLSILQWTVVFIEAWHWFVDYYGDWTRVVQVPWTVWMEPIIAQLTVFCAQLFFAYRCFILTGRNRVLLILLVAAMTTTVALFTLVGVSLAIDPYNLDLDQKFTIPALAVNLSTDAVITGLSTWKLMTSKKGFNPNTDSVVNKLLAVTWEAAVPPVISASLNIVVFITMSRQNLIYTFFNVLTPRLYVFSLMFTLNSRTAIRSALDGAAAFEGNSAFGLKRLQTESSHFNGKNHRPTTTTVVFAPIGGATRTTATSTTAMTGTIGTIDEHIQGARPISQIEMPVSETDLQIDLDKFDAESGEETDAPPDAVKSAEEGRKSWNITR